MMFPNIEQLHGIFYSSQFSFTGDKDLLKKVHFLLQESYLLCEQIEFVTKDYYLDLASDTQKLAQAYEADGGSPQHVALKLIARDYLRKLKIDSACEQSFCGFYPDIISIDRKIICECGHTDNIDKMFTYFTQGQITEFIQLPYPDLDDKKLLGYSFTANSSLKEFLDLETSQGHAQIKAIINRKR